MLGSKYEDHLAKQLDKEHIRYVRQFQYAPPRRWKADFMLNDYNLIVEVQGISYKGQAFGHQTGPSYQQDCLKHNEAAIRGYSILCVTPAMVMGKAREKIKGHPKIEPAIQTIKRWIANVCYNVGNVPDCRLSVDNPV